MTNPPQNGASALGRLDPLGRTAWLDAGSRALESARRDALFEDAFATWLIATFGHAPGFDRLDRSLKLGIVARTWRFDRAVIAQIERAMRSGETVEIWSLGAGFDTRWMRLAEISPQVVSRYVAFDTPEVIEAKRRLFAQYPLAERYDLPEFRPVSLPESLADALPSTMGRVIVVAEGLVDFLAPRVRADLLDSLKRKAPRSVLLLDALSRRGTDYDNRRPERYTGDPALRMADAPDDPVAYHAAAGWLATDRQSLFAAMRDVLVHRHPRLLGRMDRFRLPHGMSQLYQLHTLEPAEREARAIQP